MCDKKEALNKTKTGEAIHAVGQNAGEEAAVAAAPVQMEQPVVVQAQAVRQREITEILPMRRELLPIPPIEKALLTKVKKVKEPAASGLSFKKRRELEREDERLRAEIENPYVDHVSVEVKRQMDELTAEKEPSKVRGLELYNEAKARGMDVDTRVLDSYTTGYKADAQGNPLNEQEAERKRQDEQFLEDYCSCDLQRRKPHLERIKNEMLNVRLTPDMLTDTYIERHQTEVYDVVTKMTYFENLQKDSYNAPYFESLPEVEKKLLKYRVGEICATFSNLWTAILASKGITISGTHVEYVEDKAFHDPMAMQIPGLKKLLKKQIRERDKKEKKLLREAQIVAGQQRIENFNEAVGNSMPEPALDKALGSEADYESLRSLFHDEIHEELRAGQTFRVKGLIELSDHEFETHGESNALQAFQIRESAKEAAKRDKKLRGQFFLDIPKDYVQMFRNMQDAGVDFEAMSSKFSRVSCGMGAYVSGGGIEQVHDKMFANFQKYIEAPQGQEYVQKMKSILGNAKVFEGNPEKCVNYILQCLLNSYGANYVNVSADAAYYGEHAEAAKKVCMESCRNLLILPRIVQLSGKEKAGLPPEIARLGEQYRQLIQQLSQK